MSEINRIVSNMNQPDLSQLNEAILQFGEAAAGAFTPLAEAFNTVFQQMPPDIYHKINVLHPRDTNEYYREAEPAEVVQYILQQPDHTWMGVTIYPDEAWRYEHKSDWMWWRQ